MKKAKTMTRDDVSNLTAGDIVTILEESGSESISLESLQNHIDSGAPVNPDGTLDLIAYAAWLARTRQ